MFFFVFFLWLYILKTKKVNILCYELTFALCNIILTIKHIGFHYCKFAFSIFCFIIFTIFQSKFILKLSSVCTFLRFVVIFEQYIFREIRPVSQSVL